MAMLMNGTPAGKGVLPVSSEYSSNEAHGSGPKNNCTFEESLKASLSLGERWREACIRVDEPGEY